MTKKKYNLEFKRINTAIELLKELQEKYMSFAQNTENDLQIRTQYGDRWNEIEDTISILNNELRNLEHQWETRNWNGQDWAEYSLVCANID